VPLLFPAVAIDGAMYCDGGMRQLVPLAPACRLGADALLVINPSAAPEHRSRALEQTRERMFASPIYLAGKALDTLFLDRLDDDLLRLHQINELLHCGRMACGAKFMDCVGRHAEASASMRPLDVAVVRPSVPLAFLCADYVRAPGFQRRRRHAVEWAARWLAELEGGEEATLLSYLLFDGPFAAQLMELGFADARAQHDALCRLFSPGKGHARPLRCSLGALPSSGPRACGRVSKS